MSPEPLKLTLLQQREIEARIVGPLIRAVRASWARRGPWHWSGR